MKEIIIGTTAAYANGITSISNVTSLSSGSIACIDEDGNLISGSTPSTSSEKVRFYLGRSSTEGVYRSCLISRKSLSYTKQDYSAPVTKIIQLGSEGSNTNVDLNLPTITAGLVFTIVIFDLEKDFQDSTRVKYYSYTAKSSDTNTSVITKLVALINADSNCPCTATDTTSTTHYGIKLTGKSASTAGFKNGHQFGVACMDSLVDADIVIAKNNSGTACLVNGTYYDASTSTTLATKIGSATSAARAGSKGFGDPTVIAELEAKITAEDGNTDREFKYNVWNVSSKVVAGTSYTVYTLTWKEESDYAEGIQHHSPLQYLMICVPDSSAAETALDTILAAL